MTTEWWIHLTKPSGRTQVRFTGTREEAEAKAASYIGKPGSINVNKRPHQPNMWDLYSAYRIEKVGEV